MSRIGSHHHPQGGWWESLGLHLSPDLPVAAWQVLCEYAPVGFRSASGGSDVHSLDEIVALVDAAVREANKQRELAAAERHAAEDAEFEASFGLPDADALVDRGQWSGFTRGEAMAWCWNLFQYEPHGFVHPGSQVRAEALSELRAGGLPEVFGYPERAHELAATGMTARQYREHRRALRSRTFDPADVRRS
ncbi:MAG: hypothetical protein WCY76_07495 [Leucobacter sp.]